MRESRFANCLSDNSGCNIQAFRGTIKKKAIEKAESKRIVINSRPYKVDGEVGRFEFQTHRVVNAEEDKTTLFDTSISLFPVLRGNEYYRTVDFKEVAYIYGDIQISFRKTADGINRFRYQEEDGTPHRTLHEGTVREGAGIIDYLDRTSDRILRQNEFYEDGLYEGPKVEYFSKNEPVCMTDEEIAEAADLCHCPAGYAKQDLLNNPVLYENQAHSTDISIDDVVVKKQETTRTGNNSSDVKKRKYVHNTVAHIVNAGGKYTLNGFNTIVTLRYVLAFLLNNSLVDDKRFQFFTDGHKILNKCIFNTFSWNNNIGLILDWYHLQKNVKKS